MLPIQFTYLFGACLFLIPWGVIFIIRRDLRELLIQVGLLFIPLGLVCEYFWWTKDWWKPYTVTKTTIGFEDVILGFLSGGVAASLYLVIYKKKFVHNSKTKSLNKVFKLGMIIFLNLILFGLLFGLGINSFTATLSTIFSAYIMLVIQKKELVFPSIINGFLMVILVIPIYLAMIYVTPTFVEKTWMVNNLLGIYLLGVPVEDYIFYFLSGLLCFNVYPFYKDAKLIDTNN